MQIVRSILAILVGVVVAIVVISSAEFSNFIRFGPPNTTAEEFRALMETDKQKVADWVKTLPPAAMVMLVVGWAFGAFLGGAVAALIAGRARGWHAGIIGAIILISTIINFFRMKITYEVSHPDWVIITGLLLPLPMSLIGGKLASLLVRGNMATPPP
jgi:hypothetical protein